MSRSNARAPTPDLAVLVGDSPVITAIRRQIDRIADADATVLVTGPSGSGKDIVARLIHQRGKRGTRPFVAFNCAAVSRDLMESELFGHEAGAFTGAVKARAGRFEAAADGTVFLDELGDMSVEMQVKLLRLLETRVVERVGGMLPIAVDARVVAATSVDLDAAVASGRFRADLLYRLDVVRIEMPPLRQRPQDIPALIEHLSAGTLRGIRFDESAVHAMMGLDWPGNVRELKNIVDRAEALFPGELVTGPKLASMLRPSGSAAQVPEPAVTGRTIDLKKILAEIEQAYIVDALNRSGGGVSASAKMLGLQRTTLVEKMRRLHIGTA